MMGFRELFLTNSPHITQVNEQLPAVVDVVGVPFDATSTFRTGSRDGPNAFRNAYANIEIYSNRLGVDLERLRLDDLGNLAITTDAGRMVNAVKGVTEELLGKGKVPALIGGEHTLTFGSYEAMDEDVALLVFDAHFDLRDEFADERVSHATYLRRLTERRKVEHMLHVGARAGSAEEWATAERLGLPRITTHALQTLPAPERLLGDALRGYERVYISIDLDVLDPSCAPGVGNPEPAGISSYQLLELLYSLRGKKICGFDIVELCPPFDGGITACLAARLFAELCCLAWVARG